MNFGLQSAECGMTPERGLAAELQSPQSTFRIPHL
jgi:hypothetical protein